MKTGGTTLTWHARATYGMSGVYPYHGADDGDYLTAYTSVRHVLARPRDRLAQVRVLFGHLPLELRDRLPHRRHVICVLRHPVDRVTSFLRSLHHETGPHRGATAEEIYDHPHVQAVAVDHQTKMLSVTAADGLDVVLDAEVSIDEGRLRRAVDALESIELLAVHETYPDLLAELEHDHGWRIDAAPDQNVGRALPVSASLRARILADNQADLELYHQAVESIRRRGSA